MIIGFRREPWTVDSESDSFIFHFEISKKSTSLPRGVVLSRNQITAIGLPEFWVSCLADAAEPHWWQEFWPSNRWFSSCSARVMWKLATLEKCWNPTRETNGKGRKNPTTPQDFPLQKSHEPKRRPAFFPMATALLDAWIESECISRCLNSCLKLKKNGKWSCIKCHSATYVGLDSMDRWKISHLCSQPNLNCQTSIRFYPWTLSCCWWSCNCENLSIDFSARSTSNTWTRFPSFFWIQPNT